MRTPQVEALPGMTPLGLTPKLPRILRIRSNHNGYFRIGWLENYGWYVELPSGLRHQYESFDTAESSQYWPFMVGS